MAPELSEVALKVDQALLRDPHLPLPGATIAGRYRIKALLGFGGMSAVYAAEDAALGRELALKVLYPKLKKNEELVTRFVLEASTLAKVRSRHVVAVYDIGFTHAEGVGELPFMTLELLRGVDLWTAIHEHARPEVARGVRYIAEACEGLAAAHVQGIVHRDLKPENLFVAQDADGSEYVKVFDFGIAKAPRPLGARPLTRVGESMGSPRYMSPEQLQLPQDIDARSDVWALGAVLYEVLTGRPAFEGGSPLEICSNILSKRPIAPSAIRQDLPPGLSEVVERCLSRDRAARYADMAELCEALAPFVEVLEEPPHARVLRVRHVLGRETEETPILLRRRRAPSLPSLPEQTPAPRSSGEFLKGGLRRLWARFRSHG
jgi:serine/threonine protein kinase